MNKTDRKNTDTSKATQQRIKNSDNFARSIIAKFDAFEIEHNVKFETLAERKRMLNELGIQTSRGSDFWTTTAVRRILKRNCN